MGKSYSSADLQSVYSTAPADWAIIQKEEKYYSHDKWLIVWINCYFE